MAHTRLLRLHGLLLALLLLDLIGATAIAQDDAASDLEGELTI